MSCMVSAAIHTLEMCPFSSMSIKTEEKVHCVEKDVCIITGSVSNFVQISK